MIRMTRLFTLMEKKNKKQNKQMQRESTANKKPQIRSQHK